MTRGGNSRRAGRVSTIAAAVFVFAAVLALTARHSRAQASSSPAPATPEFVAGELIVRLTDGDSATKLAALLARIGAVPVAFAPSLLIVAAEGLRT